MAKRGVEAVGIDLSAAMISEAQIRVPDRIFRRMDLRQLRYPSDTFSGVWACATLHHLSREDTIQGLKEFVRVLKPEGILGVSIKIGQGEAFDSLGRYQKFYNASDFRRLIIESGFHIISESFMISNKDITGCEFKKEWLQILAKKLSNSFQSTNLENECFFCPESRFRLCREVGLPAASSILWGDENLYIIPDIAPLIEGHILMVTTDHYMCFGASPNTLDCVIQPIKIHIHHLFQKVYNKVPLFLEHGPVQSKKAGACIDHAHLHCLPVSLELKDAIEKYVGFGQKASINTLRQLTKSGKSYLYIEEDIDKGWVYQADVAPSQFFRQVVAMKLGHANWKWHLNYDFPDSKHTFKNTLKGLISSVDELFS